MAGTEMHDLHGAFVREKVIPAGGFRAAEAFIVEYLGINNEDVALLFADACPDGQLAVPGTDRFQIARLHRPCHPCRLLLAGPHPAADLVKEQSLYAAMDNAFPTLVNGRRGPKGDDIIALLDKFQMQTNRIVRSTP